MLANPHFAARIRSAGIAFLPLGEEKDFLDVLHDPRLARQGQSPFLVIQALFNKSVEPSFQAMEEAILQFKPDVIVRHHIFFSARWAAERHRIPVVTCTLTPSMWLNPDEGMIMRGWMPPRAQLALSGLLRFAGKIGLRLLIDRPVNAARKRLGLPAMRDVFYTETGAGNAVLGLWSPQFRKPMPGDPPKSIVCGFCFFDRAGAERDRALDPGLEEFLSRCESSGTLPVVFSLGTTIVHHANDFFAAAVHACRKAALPSVLLVGRGESAPPGLLGPDVCAVEYAPHSLVFPRCSASVHHAGAGSSAQAMRSGKPSIAAPFVNDEFDIAYRMSRLGVAYYLPATRINTSRRGIGHLAEALRQVTGGVGFRERASTMGALIRAEHGPARAAEEVERVGLTPDPRG